MYFSMSRYRFMNDQKICRNNRKSKYKNDDYIYCLYGPRLYNNIVQTRVKYC